LVEARERKHHFQREAIRRLDLENVQALLGRSEALEPQRHQGVVAQAMARPREVVPLLLPWADAGAWLAIPGGQGAPLVEAVPGVSSSEIRRYRVAATGVERTVWIGRREATLP
jgi:16S rRNA G527 N7-methylase RsmG